MRAVPTAIRGGDRWARRSTVRVARAAIVIAPLPTLRAVWQV